MWLPQPRWLVAWLGFGPKVSPLYISVITLVLSVIFVQVIYSGGDFTGSSSGLSNFDTFDISMEGWFRIAGAFLVAVTAAGWIFVRSDFGRLLVAIRENEQRCRYCGIGTARVKTLLLIGSAIITALAGFAYAGYNDVIAPDLGNFQFGTQLVIWVALGGRGTLVGPAIAAVMIDFISAWLSGVVALHLAAHHRLGVHRGDRASAAGSWSRRRQLCSAAAAPERSPRA